MQRFHLAAVLALAACRDPAPLPPAVTSPAGETFHPKTVAAPAPPPPAAPVETLPPGTPAPAFSALDDAGRTWSLADLAGKSVVLYFYPKDDTPGCTIEAQGFRDSGAALAAKGAVVLGVSLDDAASHQAFRRKYALDFPLLVDGAALARAYGVPVNGGHAARQTFVIGPDGKVKAVFRKVTAMGHANEVLATLGG